MDGILGDGVMGTKKVFQFLRFVAFVREWTSKKEPFGYIIDTQSKLEVCPCKEKLQIHSEKQNQI